MDGWVNDGKRGRDCFWVKWVHWLISQEEESCAKSEGQRYPILYSTWETQAHADPQGEEIRPWCSLCHRWSYLSLRRDFWKCQRSAAAASLSIWNCLVRGPGVAAGLVQSGATWICSTAHHLCWVPTHRRCPLLWSVSDHLLTFKWPEWCYLGSRSFIKMGALFYPLGNCFIQCQEQ